MVRSPIVPVARLTLIALTVWTANAGLAIRGCQSCVAEEAASREAVVERVRQDVQFLTSEELQGRGIDTTGIEKAATRIVDEYQRLGLKAVMPDGGYRQTFPVTIGDVSVSADTALTVRGPDGALIEPAVAQDFQPIRRGNAGKASAGLVFLGYGISSAEDKYNDFEGIDLKGRIAIVIRREPRQGQENGPFRGTEVSPHSYIDTKLRLLADAGAAGLIFVNDPHSAPTPERDELTPPGGFGTDGAPFPFVHVRQSIIDQILRTTPLTADGRKLSSLSEVAAYIDETLRPVSQELPGWTADVSTGFVIPSVNTDNIIGVLEGSGPLAEETIIIGGHYDHLGYGPYGSRAPARAGEIHNGADDNASGTAAVLEMARRMAAGPAPRRRMVFICFSGEERGLLGSQHYVRHPVFPLDKTVFMLNFDMIGSLRNQRVEVNGVGSATEFAELVSRADEQSPLTVAVVENPFGGSDHLPFYQKQIPVLFSFTGITSTYHTPDDDFESLNIPGIVDVIDLSETLLRSVDAMDQRPTFQEVRRQRSRTRKQTPFLGIMPELGDSLETGVRIRGVRPNSPAQAAAIQSGDLLLRVNSVEIADYPALISQLEASKVGDEWTIVLKRGDQEIETTVKLGAPTSP